MHAAPQHCLDVREVGMPQKLQCFLYHSELDPEALVICVPDILKEARRFNKAHQITGLLMFDGHRFAQYIEGPPDMVELLIDKLYNDPRHANFTQQYNALRTCDRLFPSWSMAYVLLEGDNPLRAITSLRGDLAMKKLEKMMPDLNFD